MHISYIGHLCPQLLQPLLLSPPPLPFPYPTILYSSLIAFKSFFFFYLSFHMTENMQYLPFCVLTWCFLVSLMFLQCCSTVCVCVWSLVFRGQRTLCGTGSLFPPLCRLAGLNSGSGKCWQMLISPAFLSKGSEFWQCDPDEPGGHSN